MLIDEQDIAALKADYLRLVHEMKTVSTSSLDPTFEQVEMIQPKIGVLGSSTVRALIFL